jgi:iron complex outermembrane recepter protein
MHSRSIAGNFRLVLIASSCLVPIVPHAQAQQALELDGIVVETRKKQVSVTNSRLEGGGTPSGNALAPNGSTPDNLASSNVGITGASTTVITREQIERAPQTTLADIIGAEAGVQTRSLYGGVNGVGTTVDLRGFGASAPSNTLVLINGRRLNDWDSAGFDLSTIARESVERIEITRGNSGAVLYGDGAVGGVINIVTRSGAGLPNQLRVEGGVGSFATRQGNLTASASSGDFSAFVNGHVIESDGYRDNNELNQSSVVGDFRWAFAKGSVYLNIAADDQSLGFPGERMVRPAINLNELRDDRRGTSTPFDYGDKQGARGTVGFTYMLGSNLELIVDGGIRTKAQQAGFFSPFQEAYVDTDLTTLSFTPRISITQPFMGLPSRILAGIDVYDTDYESHRSMFKSLAPIHIYNGGQETLAAYWQQTVSVLPTTDFSAGARIQRNRTSASDLYDPTAPGAFGLQGLPLDDSETNHAWHLGIEHKLLPSVTVFGRLAQSFRVANIDERIGSALFGSPTDFNLRTQKSHDWEAGVRLQNGPFKIQSSYYEMQLTDELHFDPFNFINTNLDPTRRRGVETIASWQMMKNLRLYGNLTFTDAIFRDGPNAGNDVPLVSRWTGNVGLSWNIIDKKLTFDTIVHYVGERRMDNDQANFQPQIPAYTTLDLQLSGKMDQFLWSAAVANLFDVEYFDYSVASAFTPGAYNAYPLPGRIFMVKAGTTW